MIVNVDYFTKWVEAELLYKITENKMIHFIWKFISYELEDEKWKQLPRPWHVSHLKKYYV